jgi:hypothetical protein
MKPIQLIGNQIQHHAQHDAANGVSAVAVLSVSIDGQHVRLLN